MTSNNINFSHFGLEKLKWVYLLIQICYIWHMLWLLVQCPHFFWRSVYGSVAVGKMISMNLIKNRKYLLKSRLALGYPVFEYKKRINSTLRIRSIRFKPYDSSERQKLPKIQFIELLFWWKNYFRTIYENERTSDNE